MTSVYSALVSIILPTYNGSRYIQHSIDSCLNQTYSNIELIIIDDCSTDKTPEIVKSCKDNRIKYFRHKQNCGLPAALNTGFLHASGVYLTWTSDDNYYVKDAIEKQVSFLETNNCDFVYCDFFRFTDFSPEFQLVTLPDMLALEKMNNVGPCTLYSKRVVDVTGLFDVQTELAEDYDYWLRVSKNFSMFHLAKPLYFYREHPNSLSSARFYEVRAAEILVKSKNHLDYDETLQQFVDLLSQQACPWQSFRTFFARIFKIAIKRKVHAFEAEKLSFKEARLSIKKITQQRIPSFL